MTGAPIVSAKPAKKRIASFLDGTWNVVDDNTNVWRLKSLCATHSPDDVQQLAYYSVGVGTSYGEKAKGGFFGYGLDHEITQAYEWLIDNFEEGDDIFIFGFSRGAFTARSLAGFIAKCGLLIPGAPLGVKQLYSRYHLGSEERTIWQLFADQEAGKTKELPIEEQWMLKYAMRVPIKFVGVWDTVGALGIPVFHISGISRSTFGWLNTGLRVPIQHGFHAMAIDEHRKSFSPTLWTKVIHKEPSAVNAAPRPLASVEQRWFVGAHANVGGGYQSDLLAQKPLRWMMSKASSRGLTFRGDVALDGDAAHSAIADSYRDFMYGAYRFVSRPYYRPLGEAPKETADSIENNVNETIDASVFERWRKDANYRPKNLVNWTKAYNADPSNLITSVMAHDPNTAVPD
jgi:uncharacterized protein (DUF2235 family)